MAGMKVNLKARAEASTILEVIISMVLIMAVFGIATMIVTNVLNMSLSSKKLKAETLLRQAADSKTKPVTGTTFFYAGETQIVQDVKPYGENSGLLELHLSAYDGNKKLLAVVDKIILNND